MRIFDFFLMSFILAATLGACGSESQTDCDREEKIRKAALKEGCKERDDECWHCDCDNRGLEVHTEASPSGVVFSCVEPEEPEPCEDIPTTPYDECACEGPSLQNAQDCLADVETCTQMYIGMQNQACANTLK